MRVLAAAVEGNVAQARQGGRWRRPAARLAALSLLLTAAVGAGAGPASAGAKSGALDFATEDSVAQADNGDRVTVSGEGTFSLQPKSISGEGTFTHRDAAGTVLAQGTWEATSVLSYQSYGPATAAQQAEFGGALPPGSEGGQLHVTVALFVAGTHVHDALVTITCLLGVPPPNAEESTLVNVQDTPYNFHQAISGDNIFIRH